MKHQSVFHKNVRLQSLVAALLATWLAGASAADNARRGIDPRAAMETTDRDDRNAGPAGMAEAACETGVATLTINNPADACLAAYGLAKGEKQFTRALRYASLGCQKYKSGSACRGASSLPLWMGNEGIAVPASFKIEMQRLARFVCFSGERIVNMIDIDIARRECNYLAQQFALAKNPEYSHALAPAARRFFESIYDPAFAVALHKSACDRWKYPASCESALNVAVAGNTGGR